MRKNKYIKSYLDNFFLLSYSDLFRVSMDPRVKPEGDGRGMMPEGDGRRMVPKSDGRRMMPEGDGLNDVNSMFPEIFPQSRKIGMTMMMWILVSSLTMTNTVHAECVPTPDCASIGYTASSCDGNSLKCPFDTSKLFCMPCDTKYKYSCSDTGQVGSGDSCNGKYISCECSDGGTFVNGECPHNCTVGMIYYSDKSCSSSVVSGKIAIGVVVKENELVMSQKASSTMDWSNSYIDTSLTNYTSGTDAKTDYNGKSNTAIIIAEDSNNVAAKYCNTYTTSGTSAGDWYLPAAGELYSYVYGNYSKINTTMTNLGWSFGSIWLWSSSEYNNSNAWFVGSYDGTMGYTGKDGSYSVSCFLDIS